MKSMWTRVLFYKNSIEKTTFPVYTDKQSVPAAVHWYLIEKYPEETHPEEWAAFNLERAYSTASTEVLEEMVEKLILLHQQRY